MLEMTNIPSRNKAMKKIHQDGMNLYNRKLLQNAGNPNDISPNQMMAYKKFNKQVMKLCQSW